MPLTPVTVTVTRPAKNVRVMIDNGRTAIVGGTSALTVDDDYTTYVRRDFTGDEVPEFTSGDAFSVEAIAIFDLDPIDPDPGWDSWSVTAGDVLVRAYRTDTHGLRHAGLSTSIGPAADLGTPLPTSPATGVVDKGVGSSDGQYEDGFTDGGITNGYNGLWVDNPHPEGGCAITVCYLALRSHIVAWVDTTTTRPRGRLYPRDDSPARLYPPPGAIRPGRLTGYL